MPDRSVFQRNASSHTEKIYGDFLDAFQAEVSQISTGNPLVEGTRMGPMISRSGMPPVSLNGFRKPFRTGQNSSLAVRSRSSSFTPAISRECETGDENLL